MNKHHNPSLMNKKKVTYSAGSDAVESAKREIDLWFKPEEVITYSLCEEPMVYE
jgi:hypothetical protein